MNTGNPVGGTGSRGRTRTATVKAIIGAGIAMIGITMAEMALADRDSYPAWHRQQVFGPTASPEMVMAVPRTVLPGRGVSFQNWHYRQYVQQSREQASDSSMARAQSDGTQPGAILR